MYTIVSENELYHWDKGGQASKHKYIDRKMKNGRWVYIYPGDQYKKAKREAYLAKGRSEAERSGYGAMNQTRANQKYQKTSQKVFDEYDRQYEKGNKYKNRKFEGGTVRDRQRWEKYNRDNAEAYEEVERTRRTSAKNASKSKKKVDAINNTVADKIDRGKRKLKKYLNRGVRTKIKEPKTSNKTEKVNLSELEKQGYKKNTEKGNSQKKRKKGLRLPNGTYIRFRTKK